MNKEILSQLLDNELDEQEMNDALDALLADSDAQQSWHAMHLVRGVVSEEGGVSSLSLLDRISVAIEDEPLIMAPGNLPEPLQTDESGVKRNKMPAYIALAASVVALALFSYSPLQNQTSNEVASALQNETTQSQLETERELQSMVVQHGEFSGAVALNGLVAYAKVVNGSTAAGTR